MTLWIAYLMGAFLMLIFKYGRYLYESERRGIGAGRATLDWLFEGTAENAVSWTTSIAIVWVAGAMYVDRLDWLFAEYFAGIPAHPAIAFFLGVIVEQLAPNVAKAVWARLPLPNGWRANGK